MADDRVPPLRGRGTIQRRVDGEAVVLRGDRDASGAVIGEGDIEAQTKQVMVNVMACLAAAGTQATDLVSLEIKVVAGVDLRAAAQSAADYLDPNSLPLVSVSVVQQLARPGALVEVSAVAARLDASDAVWLGRGEVADPAWF